MARRKQLLEQTIAELHAPLHDNCYLSPTQFAERFGLPPPAAKAQRTASEVVEETAPEPVRVDAANHRARHRPRRWALWLALGWALAATAAAVSAISSVWR
jgi:hypothetical protein